MMGRIKVRMGAWTKRYSALFNFREDLAKGRTCMILSGVVVSIANALSAGLFYTSFLMANGIDLVKIGIISFIPFIANCFGIFSPSILERFKRRKFILSATRMLYYTLNILGVTVMPQLVSDPDLKMTLFVIIIFAANIINALFTGGYSVWHLNFLPDKVRAEYFSVAQLTTNLSSTGMSLLFGFVADILSGSPYEDAIIVGFRYAAFIFAIVEVLILAWPKEYPYQQTENKPRLRDVIVKPFEHKKFMMTMLMIFGWTFSVNIPASSINYYLLDSVGVSYSFINIINVMYPIFLTLFLPFWKRRLNRWGWFKTYGIGGMLTASTVLLYSCVTADNYLWLFTFVRLAQHFIGVGFNVANSNMSYINMPETDQTNYVAFYILTANLASFLGMLIGTSFVAAFSDLSITIFGLVFTPVQILMWFELTGQVIVASTVLRKLPQLTPN